MTTTLDPATRAEFFTHLSSFVAGADCASALEAEVSALMADGCPIISLAIVIPDLPAPPTVVAFWRGVRALLDRRIDTGVLSADLHAAAFEQIDGEWRDIRSQATKAGLADAKANGARLGNPNGAAALRRTMGGNKKAVAAVKNLANKRADDLRPILAHLRSIGVVTFAAIARELNMRNIATPRGGEWHASSVKNLMARIDAGGAF